LIYSLRVSYFDNKTVALHIPEVMFATLKHSLWPTVAYICILQAVKNTELASLWYYWCVVKSRGSELFESLVTMVTTSVMNKFKY